MLRLLASNDYIEIVTADVYAPTHFTKALTVPRVGDGIPYM